VIKPHGSIDRSQEVHTPADGFDKVVLTAGTPEEQQRNLVDLIPDLVETHRIEYYGNYIPVINASIKTHSADFALPAVAVPLDQTSQYVCPTEHLSALCVNLQ
jgi:hypothetical protein